MKRMAILSLALACVSAFQVCNAQGASGPNKLEVGAPFNDGMVLQRDSKVPVWGRAEPGRRVTVSFAEQVRETVAGADGAWRVDLDPMPACSEGRTLTVSSDTTLSFGDILVGEVWWCSGQSNMELVLFGSPTLSNHANRDINGALDAAMANERLVRGATVKRQWDSVRRSDGPRLDWRPFEGTWLRGFSAIAFHYAITLHRVLGVPVGVVCSSWGGTRIEPWISAEGFSAVPEVAKKMDVQLVPPPSRLPEAEAGALPEWKRRSLHQQPTAIFNCMVAPYAPMAVKGAIWYQGESNLSGYGDYAALMHALYATLSQAFEKPDLPLEFVQIAPFHYDWAEGLGAQAVARLWEEQSKFAAEEKNADMAVICDVGETDNIHPAEKRAVALRLAAQALNKVYGRKDIPCESPILRRHSLEGGVYTLEFDNVAGWYYRSKQPIRFEVAGADGQYVLGKVDVSNAVIRVSSPDVPEPRHLRYLWNWDWLGYLTNENGLPLGGFKIDEP